MVRIAQDQCPFCESRMKGGQFIRNPVAKPVAPHLLVLHGEYSNVSAKLFFAV